MKFLYIKFDTFSKNNPDNNTEVFIEIGDITSLEIHKMFDDPKGEQGFSIEIESKKYRISGVLNQPVDFESFIENQDLICPMSIQGTISRIFRSF